MTDKPIRPDADPSREPDLPEPDEPVNAAARHDVDTAEDPTSIGEAQSAPDVPEDATAETGDEHEPIADEGRAVEPASEASDPDAAGTAAGDVVEEPVAEARPDAAAGGPGPAPADEEEVDPEPASSESAATAEPDVATETERGDAITAGGGGDDVFVWHPDHKGKSFDDVRSALAQDIAADQRQHRLAMEGAEESEQEALASVVGLERKWGPYDFDWAEQEPEDLADRILEFERERERRRELITWADFRHGEPEAGEAQVAGERAPELSTSAKGLSLLLVVLLIVVILLAVWAL